VVGGGAGNAVEVGDGVAEPQHAVVPAHRQTTALESAVDRLRRRRRQAPRRLAQQVFEQVEEMRDIYAPKIPLDVPAAKKPSAGQGGLPFKK
jgi:hypothetical protein